MVFVTSTMTKTKSGFNIGMIAFFLLYRTSAATPFNTEWFYKQLPLVRIVRIYFYHHLDEI